ncbi:hypothetical protein E2I00_010969 [Balaenoptera physalus]|uniref:Uncharacterized protein n=1 Tax=Balaenoptera physalus TaxID=9770 RepID=A0A643C2W7_BALPH|nr:hypothetical protein E2I00_010969 [Balaenoptera physalus]
MAPEGWKNTGRHDLCFRDSFEKVPVGMQALILPLEVDPRGAPPLCRGGQHLGLQTGLENIQQCMSQPDVMPSLFDL